MIDGSTSTPLERIRLRPVETQRSEAHLRLEQRVVPMLLKCIPELIKQDLIASRTMTVTGIMYRLLDGLPAWWELGKGEHPQAAHGTKGGSWSTRLAWWTSEMEKIDEQVFGAESGAS